MEIKRQLKNIDVRLSKLARDLNISRPTLDYYIECFEKNKKIPNELYQEVFEYMFDDQNQNTIDFVKKFDYVKRNFLASFKENENNKKKEMRDVISDYAFDKDSDKNMIDFLHLFITNEKVPLLQSLIKYFVLANGIEKLQENLLTDKDKALYSSLHNVFESYKNDKISLDEIAYLKFTQKCELQYKKKETTPKSNELIDYLQKNLTNNDNIDLEYIKKLLDEKGEY